MLSEGVHALSKVSASARPTASALGARQEYSSQVWKIVNLYSLSNFLENGYTDVLRKSLDGTNDLNIHEIFQKKWG